MGLLSGIFKGIGRAAAVIKDLPGKITRWDLSRDIRKDLRKAEREAAQASQSMKSTVQRDSEIDELRRMVEDLQKQNALLMESLNRGAKYGNAKASHDINKLSNQQKVADAIDAERDKVNAVPGSPEWDEARQRALDKIRVKHLEGEWKDPSDPDTDMTIDLTPEEQAALRYFEENPDSPWYYPE